MANLKEITAYKAKLMEVICTSTSIANLLHVTEGNVLYGKDLAYKQVFPYSYIPTVTEHAQCFVCFNVNVPSSKNNVIKDIQITIYVMCEKKLMRMTDGSGIRIDLMASEVDKLLNGNYSFGLGEMELLSMREFVPIDGYYGNEIRYHVKDFNRSLCDNG